MGRLPPWNRERIKNISHDSKTVCPFQTVAYVGHFQGIANYQDISILIRTFYKRLHALLAFLSVSVRVLIVCISPSRHVLAYPILII